MLGCNHSREGVRETSGEATPEHTERGEGVSAPGAACRAGLRLRRVRVAADSTRRGTVEEGGVRDSFLTNGS